MIPTVVQESHVVLENVLLLRMAYATVTPTVAAAAAVPENVPMAREAIATVITTVVRGSHAVQENAPMRLGAIAIVILTAVAEVAVPESVLRLQTVSVIVTLIVEADRVVAVNARNPDAMIQHFWRTK